LIGSASAWFLLLFHALFVLTPVYWVVMQSFNSLKSIQSTFGGFTFANYIEVFTAPNSNFMLWMTNSLIIAAPTTAAVILFGGLSAYGFSRMRFAGRKGFLMGFIVAQMFPGTMAMVATFILLSTIKLLDTHIGLILVYAGGSIPMAGFMMKMYLDSIPRSLDEAAMIDGASRMTVFTRIILPLAMPIVGVVGIMNFINAFNEYILANLILRSASKRTLAMGLRMYIAAPWDKNWGAFAAASLIITIPIALVFITFLKEIVVGLTKGAMAAE